MSLDSPVAILYDSNGTELAVTQSQPVTTGSQPGLMVAGKGADGGAHFFRMANDGTLFVTGVLATSNIGGTLSVQVDGWTGGVTASIREIGAATTLVSSANSSITSYNVLAANPNRLVATFYKEGAGICYVKFGTTASST